MASWPAREKRAPVVIVELLEKATRRLARPEIRQEHSVEPAALCLAADEQRAQATLRRALLAQPEQQWDRLARAFFAQGQQL